MNDAISIPSPLGLLTLRPEHADDEAFRYALFCTSRPPEWDMAPLDPQVRIGGDSGKPASMRASDLQHAIA